MMVTAGDVVYVHGFSKLFNDKIHVRGCMQSTAARSLEVLSAHSRCCQSLQ